MADHVAVARRRREDVEARGATMYSGVSVKHSFLLGSDPFDCVPIMQQPSVRLLGLKSIATKPPPSAPRASTPAPAGPLMIRVGQLEPGHTADALGNSSHL